MSSVPIFILVSDDREHYSEVYLMNKGEIIPGFNGKASKQLEEGPVLVLRQTGPLGTSDEIFPYDDPEVWEALIRSVLRVDTCAYKADGTNL